MPRSWSWMVLATGCAADPSLVEGGDGGDPACVEEERVAVADDELVSEGPRASVASLLGAVEGAFRGHAGAAARGVALRTAIARGDGPAEVVWARGAAGAPCPVRYAIPVRQTLEVDGVEAAVAEGTWVTGDDLAGFVATAPLLEVDGLSPAALIPAEWETVDLALGSAPTRDGGLSFAVSWSAVRTTEAHESMLAPGVATTDEATVATEVEQVWTAMLARE
jgi:hypothetical protein